MVGKVITVRKSINDPGLYQRPDNDGLLIRQTKFVLDDHVTDHQPGIFDGPTAIRQKALMQLSANSSQGMDAGT